MLELRACELQERSGQIEAALARLTALAAQSRRQAPWLAQRGEILIRAGRSAEARVSLDEALAELRTSRRRPASDELIQRIRAHLAGLDAEPGIPQ